MEEIKVKDHGEDVALFRSEIVGALTRMDLSRGDLAAELRELAKVRRRLPGSDHTRTFSVTTLERWYYATSIEASTGSSHVVAATVADAESSRLSSARCSSTSGASSRRRRCR